MIHIGEGFEEWEKLYSIHRPGWCGECAYGLIDPPDTTAFMNFTRVEVRLAQATAGLLTFCKCQSGQHYRQRLLDLHKKGDSHYTMGQAEYKRLQRMVERQRQGKLVLPEFYRGEEGE